LIFEKKSDIDNGLFFASGVESDAAPAIDFINSKERSRVSYRLSA